MTANDDDLQEAMPILEVRVGTRWLQRAYALTRRALPFERRLHFAAAVYSRHSAAADRQSLVHQIQERLQTATPPGELPLPAWSQSPVTGQSVAPTVRAQKQSRQAAPERWDGPPATDPERQEDRSQADAQLFQRETPVSPEVETPEVDRPAEATALPPSVANSPSLPLGAPVRTYLTRALDLRIPAVRIYANQAADRVARQHRADAVTYGRNILFRAGKYDPSTRQGLSLLGHEVTHVAQEEQGSTAQARYGWVQTESAALQNEQSVLDRLDPKGAGPPIARPPAATLPSLPAVPRTAATDRTVNNSDGRNTAPAAEGLTAAQLQQIKDAVYRDLMDRIRTEFERGG